jgi:diguanylate cyclase (GGDEF)-like protein/PAS domain S-box-containing protein
MMVISKQLQQSLSEQIFHSQYIAMMIVDDDYMIQVVNPYCAKLFGYEIKDMISKDIIMLHISQEYKENIISIVQNQMDESKAISLRYPFKHKDGTKLWLKVFGEPMGDGSYLWTAVDITKEKQLELETSTQAQIIQQMQDCVILIDFEGYIKSWNNGAQNLLGYHQDEMFNQHISAILKDSSSEVITHLNEFLKNSKNHFEVELCSKYNESIIAELSFSTLKDTDEQYSSVICYFHDITHRKSIEFALEEQRDRLDYYANHDVLTSLPNRMYFQKYLEVLIGESGSRDKKLALLFLDLDRFKEINDSLGHEIGDRVLVIISKRLQNILDDDSMVARLGGDEFTIALKDIENTIEIADVTNKIIENLAEPICIDEQMLYISSSIGISLYPDDAKNSKDLLKFADSAMYKAKEEGRNNYQFYSDDMTQSAFEKVIMEAHLREALQNGDFVVYYQPQIDAKSEKLVGMEALVRWEHQKLGVVPPSKFISLAEATGLIVDLDRFVMRQAIEQYALWYQQGYTPGKLSLNLTVQQIHGTDFIDELKIMLNRVNFKIEWLCLEVTESQIMKNPDETIGVLKELSNMGISLAIDDFGVAYSSLSQLKKIPLDILKIDQSFIEGLPQNPQDISIAKAIIALANSLDFKILAEGVEYKEQREFLLQEGCDEIQGYYYSRPITAHEIEEQFLKEHR